MSEIESYDPKQEYFSMVGGKKRKGKKGKKTKRKPRVIPTFGKRLDVYRGNALMTTGKLRKSDLIRVVDKDGNGRIKSKKKHLMGKNKKKNNLYLSGWGAEKGKFGAVRLEDIKTKKKGKKGKKAQKTQKKGKKGLFGLF